MMTNGIKKRQKKSTKTKYFSMWAQSGEDVHEKNSVFPVLMCSRLFTNGALEENGKTKSSIRKAKNKIVPYSHLRNCANCKENFAILAQE